MGYWLKVQPDVIEQIGTSLQSMGTALGDASTYLTNYVPEDGVGGWIYSEVSGRISAVRTSLDTTYAQAGPKVSETGQNVVHIAGLYREADTEAEFQAMKERDRLIDVSGLPGGDKFIPDHSNRRFDLDEEVEDVDFGYSRSNALGWVSLDTPPVDQYFEDATVTQIWTGLRDGVDYLFDFAVDLDPTLKQFGFSNPIADFERDFKGDWIAIGTAVNAMKSLSFFWKDLGAEVFALEEGIRFDIWEGYAGGVASEWLLSFAEAANNHADGLDAEADDIYAIGGSLYTLVDPILDAAADLLDLVDLLLSLLKSVGSMSPQEAFRRLLSPSNWLDDLDFALRRVISTLAEIGKTVAKIILLVDLVIAFAWTIRANVTTLTTPDYSLAEFWTSSDLPSLEV